jgi:hypothetical protein
MVRWLELYNFVASSALSAAYGDTELILTRDIGSLGLYRAGFGSYLSSSLACYLIYIISFSTNINQSNAAITD